LTRGVKNLDLLGALCIPNKEMAMIVGSGKVVRISTVFEVIGMGESPLVRFLAKFLCREQFPDYRYTTQQAKSLAAYLICCSKEFIHGCGGDTHLRVLWPHGSFDTFEALTEWETELRGLEDRMAIAASLSFDKRIQEHVLRSNWELVIDGINTMRMREI
jgi:hypothetical protein